MTDYPFGVLRINITTRCNFNCKFCGLLPGGENLDYEEVPHAKWIDAIFRLKGEFAIIISGGEPALYEQKDSLSRIVNSFPDIPIKIYTNASIPEPILEMTPRKNLGLYVSYQYGKIPLERFKKNVLGFRAAGLRMSQIHCPSMRISPHKDQILKDLAALKEAKLSVAFDHPYLGWDDETTTGRLNDKPTGEMHYYDKGGQGRDFAERKFKKRVRCSVDMGKAGNACMYFAVGPDGGVWYCYRGFVEKETDKYLGNFFDPDFVFDPSVEIDCNYYGWCNICDGFGRRRIEI